MLLLASSLLKNILAFCSILYFLDNVEYYQICLNKFIVDIHLLPELRFYNRIKNKIRVKFLLFVWRDYKSVNFFLTLEFAKKEFNRILKLKKNTSIRYFVPVHSSDSILLLANN